LSASKSDVSVKRLFKVLSTATDARSQLSLPLMTYGRRSALALAWKK